MRQISIPEPLRQQLLHLPNSACLAVEIDQRASLVIRSFASNLDQLRGPFQVGFKPEIGLFETGAAIRWMVQIFDDRQHPFQADTFLNPADPPDLRLLRLWETQETLDIHLVDMDVQYLFSRQVRLEWGARQEAHTLIERALKHNQSVREHDYVQAREAMVERAGGPSESRLAAVMQIPATDVPPLDPQQFVKYFEPTARIQERVKDPRKVRAAMAELWPTEMIEAVGWRIRCMFMACLEVFEEDNWYFPEQLLTFVATAPLSAVEVRTEHWSAVIDFLKLQPADWLRDDEPVASWLSEYGRTALTLGRESGPHLFLSSAQGFQGGDLVEAIRKEGLELRLNWALPKTFDRMMREVTGLPAPAVMTGGAGWKSLNAFTPLGAYDDKLGLYFIALCYPRNLTALQALRIIEESLFTERARIDPQVAAMLPGGWGIPVWLAASLLFVEMALQHEVSAGAIALAAKGLIEFSMVNQLIPAYAVLPQALSREQIENLVGEVLAASRLAGADRRAPDECGAYELDLIRATDVARYVYQFALKLWPMVSRLSDEATELLCDTDLPLARLTLPPALEVAGVNLPLHAEAPWHDKYLLMQVQELEREGISSEALRVLLADGQPLGVWLLDEAPIEAAILRRAQQVEDVLQREANAHAAFAPGGSVRMTLPKQVTLLDRYGTRQLVCSIQRAPGDQVRGMWVRVYEKPRDESLRRNFIVHWEPNRPIQTHLISLDYAILLHLVITSLLHDLRVAGERAFPSEGGHATRTIHAGTAMRRTAAPSHRQKKKTTTPTPIALPRVSLTGRCSWSTDEEREQVRRRAHHVDGHRRILPNGWNRRDTAEREALLDNIVLLPGETYVNPHERGLITDDAGAIDVLQPKVVVARGLAVLITNFCKESA